MPRLVEVVREEDEDEDGRFHGGLGRRQLAVDTEDMRTMIAEFEDPCSLAAVAGGASMTVGGGASMSLKAFGERLKQLEASGLNSVDALSVDYDQFVSFLPRVIPCVGCRKCVEKAFLEVGTTSSQTLEPFYITDSAILSVSPALLSDHKRLHRCLVGNYSKCCSVVENLTKLKKSKRCQLHSLDSHQCRSSSWSWGDMWDIMATECREECCIIEADSLLEMLETYLQKHKFCPDCKSKLMRAYHCLIGEVDGSKEKGYNAQLFKGFKYCRSESHLHVQPCVAYLDSLVARAQAELGASGGPGGQARERHAKTLEVGQVEVLTCIGLYLHGRLLRLAQSVRAGQLSFQLLYTTAVMAIFSKFQAFTEQQSGLSESFERLCAELQTSAADPSKMCGAEKRKKKKPNKSSSLIAVAAKCASVDDGGAAAGGRPLTPSSRGDSGIGGGSPSSEDGGYSSSREGSPTLLVHHPTEKDNHEEDCENRDCNSCSTDRQSIWTKSDKQKQECHHEMTNGGAVSAISAEQIEWFRVHHSDVDRQRRALHERMWQQFRQMENRLANKPQPLPPSSTCQSSLA